MAQGVQAAEANALANLPGTQAAHGEALFSPCVPARQFLQEVEPDETAYEPLAQAWQSDGSPEPVAVP